MDPSKRICLKNLPTGCTKREIAELIRNRTGTPIHSIDLGLGPDGETRRYAHFSCEGAKHVLEVLGSGVALRDATVYAHPAKMHYSFRYAEARRKREREEVEEKEQLAAYWDAARQRFLDRTNGGELPKAKPPKDFYASKRKYARIAAEIAQTFRHQSGAAHGGAGAGVGRGDYPRGAAHATTTTSSSFGEGGEKFSGEHSANGVDPTAMEGAAGANSQHQHHHAHGASSASRTFAQAGKKRAPRAAAAKAKAPAAPPPPPPPPEPTKEERKLSGLQAKLAALKEKLKK
ncbi:hypothetical protein ABB37_05204 [Leptomonas pyrrhocoris]|uniref:RRM domain-containing protein n=1 Tax=Leptomonas pyrrhocoris TaxID=157538 RepID=A0A0N0DVE2_LEPPY|nr:hypothetical protein ABB37_05204 [Leptomonas pyrrhocoris]KPA80234.1 hypothetical protein ABB37_05204 [Leptomonas pyrrhocoris]|eukprot:XP_015658673.1 hypothetical protein ABB37_05204 [Leptomonas pyrrhocoris]